MRIEGWEKLLAEHVEQGRDKAFAWGKHDCALWCADWVSKVTGIDHAAEWRGQYTNETELNKLLRARGYGSWEAVADACAMSRPLMLARRGDILLHPCGTLGICTGNYGVFVTERCVLTHPTLACLKAWGVD